MNILNDNFIACPSPTMCNVIIKTISKHSQRAPSLNSLIIIYLDLFIGQSQERRKKFKFTQFITYQLKLYIWHVRTSSVRIKEDKL